MRTFLISSVLLFFGSLFAYGQNKSGILLSGGAGTLDNEFVSPMTAGQIGRSFDIACGKMIGCFGIWMRCSV